MVKKEEIEEVSRYSYLGIILIQKFSFSTHLSDKKNIAKIDTWIKFFSHDRIKSKFLIQL